MDDPIIVYAVILAVVAGLLTWFVDKHSEKHDNHKHQ